MFVFCVLERLVELTDAHRFKDSEGIWPRAEATVFCPRALYAGFLLAAV